jgi:hypothetical protein
MGRFETGSCVYVMKCPFEMAAHPYAMDQPRGNLHSRLRVNASPNDLSKLAETLTSMAGQFKA